MSSLSKQSRALERRLKAIPSDVLAEVRPALVKSGHEVAGGAKVFVPVAEGDLQESIAVTEPGQTTPAYASGGKRTARENQVLVTVGNEDVRHGHLQEFGTANHEAQPFLLPSWRLNQTRIKRRIQRAITKAIKAAGRVR